MGTNQIMFWLASSAVAIVGGWWLAARPQARMRGIAVPVTALVLILSVLVVLLSATGQDVRELVQSMRALMS